MLWLTKAKLKGTLLQLEGNDLEQEFSDLDQLGIIPMKTLNNKCN